MLRKVFLIKKKKIAFARPCEIYFMNVCCHGISFDRWWGNLLEQHKALSVILGNNNGVIDDRFVVRACSLCGPDGHGGVFDCGGGSMWMGRYGFESTWH